MLKCLSGIYKYWSDDRGATMVEYGLIVAGLALAIVSGVFTFGDGMNDMLEAISEIFANAFD